MSPIAPPSSRPAATVDERLRIEKSGIAHLRRDGPRPPGPSERGARRAARHAAKLGVQLLAVVDVPLEGLLGRDRDRARPGSRARAGRSRGRGRGAVAPTLPGSSRAARRRRARRGHRSSRRPRAQPLLARGARRRGADARRSGARNAASRPGRTTVRPPGFRRSDATFATTLQEATPSEQVSEVAPRTAACTASASLRARGSRLRPRPGRGSPRRCPVARRSGRPRAPRPRPPASTRGTAHGAGGRRPRPGSGAAPRRSSSPSGCRTCARRSSRWRPRRGPCGSPPTTSGFRRSEGSSSCSTAAKKASRSRCATITATKSRNWCGTDTRSRGDAWHDRRRGKGLFPHPGWGRGTGPDQGRCGVRMPAAKRTRGSRLR